MWWKWFQAAKQAPLRWWVTTLGIYSAARLLTFVIFSWAAQFQVETSWTSAAPSYQDWVAFQYDASWYRDIAAEGYPAQLPQGPDGSVTQNAWAFFPAFPYLVRFLMLVSGGPWDVVAPATAVLLGAGATVVIRRLVEDGAPRAVAAWPQLPVATIVLVNVFPSAAVLQAAYTESLALLLISLTLWAVVRRQYWWALPAVMALGLTRAVALPIVLVVVVHGIWRWRQWRQGRDQISLFAAIGISVLAVASFISGLFWPWWCGVVTGTQHGYLLTQEAWRWVDYITPFSGWAYVPQYWLHQWAVPLMVAAAATVLVLFLSRSARRLGLELYTWAGGYLGYIAAVAEPGSSLLRFALLMFPVATITVGAVTRPRWRWWWFAAIVLLMVVGQVWWVGTIWVANPHGDYWPP